MTIHLIKLCVGIDSVDDLLAWRRKMAARAKREGRKYEPGHTTRMTPKRREEILDGGSLYWVMKGVIQARQRVIDIRPVTGEDGIPRCRFIFDPEIVRTRPQPRRAFQGWRYLRPEDAPPDLPEGEAGDLAEMPAEMRAELMELGLI
ncbi:MAG: DUF1489 family protein [Alphaproteobacteria bacterium]